MLYKALLLLKTTSFCREIARETKMSETMREKYVDYYGEREKEVREGVRSKLSLRLCPPVIPSAIRGQKALLYSSSAQFLLLRRGIASKHHC